MKTKRKLFLGALLCIFARTGLLCAKTATYDLDIGEKKVDFTGKTATALAINGDIPAPTLYFQEGDTAVIRVHNDLPGAAFFRAPMNASLHWHGMLVPNAMDGVPYVTYAPIKPGETFTYTFDIKQSGTYWYHSHSGLQEQRGLYGAIVIEPGPGAKRRYHPDVDKAVVLSDWTDENPRAVLRALKRGSEWFSIEKGSAQSVWGALRRGALAEYFKRELLRMPPMDISDVYYNRFLANGAPRIHIAAKPGDLVRLRLVDGSASTYFFLQFAGGPVKIISADGQDVQPDEENRFLIAVAETYDVLLTVPSDGSYEFRATAQDGSGQASIWLGQGPKHPAPDVPKPDLYRMMMGKLSLARIFAPTPAGTMGMSGRAVAAGKFDHPGMMGGMSMEGAPPAAGNSMGAMAGMDMGNMDMEGMNMESSAPLLKRIASNGGYAVDGTRARPGPPYARLKSVEPTAFPKGPVRTYRLTLDGDMHRYIWMINDKVLAESRSIRVRQGEVTRFILINRTMMHHPMHLHGHFFRIMNGQGKYSPLKHTVDVPPMSTVVIEFLPDAKGDWFFHCHILYHLMSGMARVVHYEGYRLSPALAAVRPKLYRDPFYFYGHADALSNMTQGSAELADTRNIFRADWEAGWLPSASRRWEATPTYGRYFNRFFTAFIGADLEKSRNETTTARGVAGIRYTLPFLIESRLWLDSDGGARFNLSKSIQLTPRLSAFGEMEYDTHDRWENRAGLEFVLSEDFSLIGQWNSDYGIGAGVRMRF
ncbi:MAG TPA: multicopper oxidase domain-containing protein [Elusimicrobiota bacterium]|nr:multicopper oxidase domain-containing protein [Elusimicrobiota bacterium]